MYSTRESTECLTAAYSLIKGNYSLIIEPLPNHSKMANSSFPKLSGKEPAYGCVITSILGFLPGIYR